jgi:hypothetical protein
MRFDFNMDDCSWKSGLTLLARSIRLRPKSKTREPASCGLWACFGAVDSCPNIPVFVNMSFLFKSRPKTPTELVQIMCEASRVMMSSDSNLGKKVRDKAVKDVTKSLSQLKAIFNGMSTALIAFMIQ